MSPKPALTTVPAQSDVTPEMAIEALDKVVQEEAKLQKCPPQLVKGARAFNAINAQRKLWTALSELNAAREHTATLEKGMPSLVKSALDAIAGVPAKVPTGKATPAGTSDAPVTPATK